MSSTIASTSNSQEIDFDSIDFEKINFEQIDVDKLDLADSTVILSLLQTPPRPALSIWPVEIWTHIVSYIDDILTLTSLNLTCMTLREISRVPLLLELVHKPPLDRLYELTKNMFLKEKHKKEGKNDRAENELFNKENNNNENIIIRKEGRKVTNKESFEELKDVIFKMHKYIDQLVLANAGPEKWTDNVFEWVGYDEKKDVTANQEMFRREVGRIGKAKTKAFVEWEARVENEKKEMRRELARVWTISGKMFPFSHAENREWKRKRQERTLIDENLSPPPQKENRENVASQQKENNKNIRDPRQSQLKPKLAANFHNRNGGSSSTASSRSKPRHSVTKSSPPQNSVKPDDSNESWKFSHEIRNQLKARRPNTDKGEKEFEKRILTPFVTPVYFSHGATFEGLKNEDLTSFMIKVTKRFCG
ncbi:8548_t:CDS:2, partial [Acaulospora morrowiae]